MIGGCSEVFDGPAASRRVRAGMKADQRSLSSPQLFEQTSSFGTILVEQRKLQAGIEIGAAQQADQVKVTEYLVPVMRIRGGDCQFFTGILLSGQAAIFKVTCSCTTTECKCKWVAGMAAAMHLDDEIIATGSLLSKETPGAMGDNIHLVDARVANELNKAIDVVVEAASKRCSPRQPYQGDFGSGKVDTNRPQCRNCKQEVAEVKCTKDSDAPRTVTGHSLPPAPSNLPMFRWLLVAARRSRAASATSSGDMSRHGCPMGHSKR